MPIKEAPKKSELLFYSIVLISILLDLVIATENIYDLVLYELLDGSSCRLEVLSGIELVRVQSEELADSCGHCKTKVGVDVDLAYGQGSGVPELIFGNTYCSGHCSAVLVDLCYKILRNGGRTVENDGESRKPLGYFFKNVEAKLRLGARLELVCAVAGTDSYGKGIAACAAYELFNLFGSGVGRILCLYLYFVFYTGQSTELCLYYYAVVVSVFNDLSGDLYVFLEGLGGSVYHNGGETAVYAALACLEGIAVIQMQAYGETCFYDSCFNKLD